MKHTIVYLPHCGTPEEMNNSTPEQFACRERIRQTIKKLILEDVSQTVEVDVSPYRTTYARDMIWRQIAKHKYDIKTEIRSKRRFSVRKSGEKFFVTYSKW